MRIIEQFESQITEKKAYQQPIVSQRELAASLRKLKMNFFSVTRTKDEFCDRRHIRMACGNAHSRIVNFIASRALKMCFKTYPASSSGTLFSVKNTLEYQLNSFD